MKHLKKFNEELSPSIYSSAARELKVKGHENRSKNLEEYAEKLRWKENIEEWKDWGKCTLTFRSRMKNTDTKVDFHIGMTVMEETIEEGIEELKEGSNDMLNFTFYIFVIPAEGLENKNENVDICKEKLPDPIFYNGYYPGFYASIQYHLSDGSLNFNEFFLEEEENKFKLDRRGINIIKKQLLASFDEGSKMSSGYTDITNMYDKIRDILTKTDFTLEFDYGMDDIYKDIKAIPVNDFYRN